MNFNLQICYLSYVFVGAASCGKRDRSKTRHSEIANERQHNIVTAPLIGPLAEPIPRMIPEYHWKTFLFKEMVIDPEQISEAGTWNENIQGW